MRCTCALIEQETDFRWVPEVMKWFIRFGYRLYFRERENMKNGLTLTAAMFALLFAGSAFAQDALDDTVAAFKEGASCATSLKGCYKEGRGDAETTKKACKSLRKCKADCRTNKKAGKKSCKGKKGKAKRDCKKTAKSTKKDCKKQCKSEKTDACKKARKGILNGLKNCAKKASSKECKNTAKNLGKGLKELL
jgi:hypothetical protein